MALFRARAVQLFAGEAKPNPYTGKMHREAQSYVFQSPSPKARQLKKFVTEALPNTVTAVSDEVRFSFMWM